MSRARTTVNYHQDLFLRMFRVTITVPKDRRAYYVWGAVPTGCHGFMSM